MATDDCFTHMYDDDNICHIKLSLPNWTTNSKFKKIENMKNLDIFVERHYLLIYVDTQLFSLNARRNFNTDKINNVVIQMNTAERYLKLQLPCLELDKAFAKNVARMERVLKDDADLSKFKRITDKCLIQTADSKELEKPVAMFHYGFDSYFKNEIHDFDSDLSDISYVQQPYLVSPLKRSVDRELEELKDFCPDQYKASAFELFVAEGHDNPKEYKFDFCKTTLSAEETTFICDLYNAPLSIIVNSTEVDCGLISILLAICYDVRTTGDDPTCESARTRTILSPTLCYFEPFYSLKNVVISFVRRTLIYTLYRNFELSRMCLKDAAEVLLRNPSWLLRQLILTHNLFLDEPQNREVYNVYYIRNYIRYLNDKVKANDKVYFKVLAENIKNLSYCISLEMIGLNLVNLEMEIVNELMKEFDEYGANRITQQLNNGVEIEDDDEEEDDEDSLDSDDDENDIDEDDDDDDDDDDEEEDDDEEGEEEEEEEEDDEEEDDEFDSENEEDDDDDEYEDVEDDDEDVVDNDIKKAHSGATNINVIEAPKSENNDNNNNQHINKAEVANTLVVANTNLVAVNNSNNKNANKADVATALVEANTNLVAGTNNNNKDVNKTEIVNTLAEANANLVGGTNNNNKDINKNEVDNILAEANTNLVAGTNNNNKDANKADVANALAEANTNLVAGTNSNNKNANKADVANALAEANTNLVGGTNNNNKDINKNEVANTLAEANTNLNDETKTVVSKTE